MSALTQTVAQNVLDAILGVASFVPPTTPMKCELDSTVGSQATASTAYSGATNQTIVFGSSAAQTGTYSAQSSNSAALSFTSLSAGTANGITILSSDATPRRTVWGALTAAKTVNLNDTLSFAIGSIVVQI